jgi:hypothetical protein
MRFANRTATRAAAATVAAGALAAGAFAPLSPASASPDRAADMQGAMGVHAASVRTATAHSFRTVDNAADLTFNQLLGVNRAGVIAGYFGSGAQGHPNMGYLLTPGGYTSENFPGSAQTQVTGLNDNGVTVGFWSGTNTASQSDDNFGFYAADGVFHSVDFPAASNANPPLNQLMDFTASSQGQINHQVRTVTGVTTPVPASGWYLNLHQGDSASILADGQPTINFRPLLCAGL